MLTPNDRKRILSVVMDFIRARDMMWKDEFPIDVVECYFSILEGTSQPPDLESFLERSKHIKTTFFRINRKIAKRDFYTQLVVTLNRELQTLLKKKRKVKEVVAIAAPSYQHVYVDDIDSFSKVRRIKPEDVKDLVPLGVSEEKVKFSLAEIIGEKFVPKDWPGEKSDLYSSHVAMNGKRIDAAFLLKGPSVKVLTIDKLGTRGNQILRLTKEPARLFVVQHIGKIDSDVIEHLEVSVAEQSRRRSILLYYCVMDGTDTARVLVAYKKLFLKDNHQ